MAKAVSIDPDTTNSLRALCEGGEPSAVPDNEDTRTTPVTVGFTDVATSTAGQGAEV
ncbi:Hsp70 family protein [Streptomyces sp. NPDC096193]|uniref:Hsp70 family protein n=1 Tax=Streptomyces sp. NPDC096193 TaxID=3155821 RepID=UPI0033315623